MTISFYTKQTFCWILHFIIAQTGLYLSKVNSNNIERIYKKKKLVNTNMDFVFLQFQAIQANKVSICAFIFVIKFNKKQLVKTFLWTIVILHQTVSTIKGFLTALITLEVLQEGLCFVQIQTLRNCFFFR